jgi:hypothetical protein
VDRQGISVVVLSYERLAALAVLLRGLLDQDLRGLPLELLVCNNSRRVRLEAGNGSEVGELLAAFPDAKVLNSDHNWLCRARYAVAILARYETIFFIDDDLAPTDSRLVRDLYDTLGTLAPVDIVSCWTALWIDWNERELTKVRMGFHYRRPTELTECDYAGPGICMFRKRILLEQGILDLVPEHLRSDSSWFPWVTAMRLGSRKYYVPSYGRLSGHEESRHASLDRSPGFRTELYSTYKRMWRRGYRPVLSRIADEPQVDRSAVLRAARSLRKETDVW